MNISSISSSSSNAYSTVNNNDEITQLEKQKTKLEKELKEVNQSKGDEKTKEEKAKLLQTQIQQIDARIQQIKAEKNNQNQSSSQQAVSAYANGKKTNGKEGANDLSDAADLTKGNANNKIDMQI